MSVTRRRLARCGRILFAAGPLFFLTVALPGVSAQTDSERLTVVMTELVPFVENDNGSADGFYAEIWQRVAREIGADYDVLWVDSFSELLPSLESGVADVAVAPIAPTAEREASFDFSSAVVRSGPQLGYHERIGGGGSIAGALIDRRVLSILGVAVAGLAVFAHAIWLVERKRHDDDGDFHSGYLKGIWDGFWWSTVTATTVGYGDKAPRSVRGRIVALVVMLSSLILVSAFVSQVTDVLSESRSGTPFTTLAGVDGRTIGSVEGTTFTAFLESEGAMLRLYPSQQEMFEGADDGDVDVVVANPFAMSTLGGEYDIEPAGDVLFAEFETFGLAQGSPLRERINMALADLQTSGEIEEIVERWIN